MALSMTNFISPLLTSSEIEWEYEQTPTAHALAEKRARYEEKTEQGD